MAINFTCTCGKMLQIDDQHAGKKVRCPACSSVVASPGGARSQNVSVAKPPPPLPVDEVEEVEEELRRLEEYDEVVPVEDDWEDDRRPRKKSKAHIPSADDFPNHNGQELPEDAAFFAPPPREIGRVLSGYTSLREGRDPMSTGARLGWVLGSTAVTFLLGLTLMLIAPAFIILAPVFALGAFLISFLATRFSHFCSYAGQDGIARIKCIGNFEKLHDSIFIFDDAEELRTSQTRHYVNGIYSGTNYAFNWTDADGRKVYSLSGQYHSEKGTPKPKDPYYFALAAELAWSEHLLLRYRSKLDEGGSVKFALRGKDSIRIGPGLVVLNRRGDKIDFEGDDIARVRIDQGVVAILEPGAKEGWFSSKGVYKFNYQDLANAQFFLFLMERLLGVRAG